MGYVEEFGIDSHELRTVALPFEVILDSVPGCGADIFQDDEWWPMIVHPRHHAMESSARLSSAINPLLFVIQVRVVDA